MKKLGQNDPETRSVDVVVGNVEALKALLPDAFAEGKIDFEVLKSLLGDTVDEKDEKYGLSWHGKRRARQIALAPSTGTLLPCPEESVDWETTQNLMIEGDNLEVLKLLQKSYANKVKLIYIDPPYNTGKDFVYPDDFRDNISNYLELTGQTDGGRKISSNTESSGRFHTNWLNMLYPRLRLARQLLRQDGVIFISINDKELSNLLTICSEIFGEENFIATLVWERGRKNDARRFSLGHEYIVGYAKDLAHIEELLPAWREPKEGVTEIVEEYDRLKSIHGSDFEALSSGLVEFYKSLPDTSPAKKYSRSRFVDKRGIWRDNNISWPGGGGPKYALPHPITGQPCKIPDDGWRFVEETMKEKIRDGFVQFREDHTKSPFLKSYLYIDGSNAGNDDETAGEKLQVMGSVFYRHSQPSNDVMKEIFGEKVFENPKDHIVLSRLIRYCTGSSDTILDFFAGSGSTGHAVWELNHRDGTKRRSVMVQLPEPLDSDDRDQALAAAFCDSIGKRRTISELTKERLRRVGATFRDSSGLTRNDIGFRVFKLTSSNIRAWTPDPDDLENSLLKNAEHIVQGRNEQDVLFELLLKLGLDLCVPIQTKHVEGKIVHSVGGGVLIVCLAQGLTKDVIEPLGAGIVAWIKQLAPAVDPRVVFNDSGFADDIAKTNMAAILSQNGISDVRSL
ncbi:MAG: site-specific DNA-methyltransferase [Rhizobiales bacterium]|nr:site-specific DNA-methyltransferase [Hyphomicrobiales bacterium]